MAPRTTFLLALALAGSLSCASHVTAPPPPPVEDIRVAITASPSSGTAGQPITVTATIRNHGDVRVVLHNRCPDPMIRIYDMQSVELFQRDPTRPVACPVGLVAPLEPGQEIVVPLTFDGGFFSHDGQHHQVPAGSYRAVTVIVYSALQDYAIVGDPRTVSGEVVFNWQ